MYTRAKKTGINFCHTLNRQQNVTVLLSMHIACLAKKQRGLQNSNLRFGDLTPDDVSSKNDGWEKDADSRRWRRCVDDRRRLDINPLPVAVRAVHTPAMSIVFIIPTSLVLLKTTVVMTVTFFIFGAGLQHVHTADHRGYFSAIFAEDKNAPINSQETQSQLTCQRRGTDSDCVTV